MRNIPERQLRLMVGYTKALSRASDPHGDPSDDRKAVVVSALLRQAIIIMLAHTKPGMNNRDDLNGELNRITEVAANAIWQAIGDGPVEAFQTFGILLTIDGEGE